VTTKVANGDGFVSAAPLEIQAGPFDPAGDGLANGVDLHPSAVLPEDLDTGAIDSPTKDLRGPPLARL
jgi:hypothetical protein